jgi:hypothetical protein
MLFIKCTLEKFGSRSFWLGSEIKIDQEPQRVDIPVFGGAGAVNAIPVRLRLPRVKFTLKHLICASILVKLCNNLTLK